MIQRILLILALVLFVVMVFTSALFVLAIKPEKIISPVKPSHYGLDYERVTFSTDDGLELVGWFIPQPKSRSVVMVGHGYPYDKGNVLTQTLFLHADYNLFYFDFRYFGESAGTYTTFGVKEKLDVLAALKHLRQRKDIDAGAIGLFGVSLSAAIFIQAQPQGIKALVVDSPFMNLETMIIQTYGFLPGPLKYPCLWLSHAYTRIFLGLRIEDASALKAIKQMHCPILFIHGAQDRQVSPRNSQNLFAACPAVEKEYWLIPEANHNNTRRVDPKRYDQRVLQFFHRYLPPIPAAGKGKAVLTPL